MVTRPLQIESVRFVVLQKHLEARAGPCLAQGLEQEAGVPLDAAPGRKQVG
jgi:hypothetical protein